MAVRGGEAEGCAVRRMSVSRVPDVLRAGPEPASRQPIYRASRILTGAGLEGNDMGRGILLWLLGVPIPVIILLALIWH